MYVVRQDKRMKQLYRWAIPIILAVVLVWWCFPRSMIPKHESVAGVHISGGMTGKGFDSNDPLQVDAVVRALSEIKTVRTLPLLGSTGFDYTLFSMMLQAICFERLTCTRTKTPALVFQTYA